MKKCNPNLFLICIILACFAIWGCNSSTSSSRPPSRTERPLAPRASKNPTLTKPPAPASIMANTDKKAASKGKSKSNQSNKGQSASESQQTINKEHLKIPIQTDERSNLVLYAAIERWYGTPYQGGGCTLQGVDCSCFIFNIYQEAYNIKLSRSSKDMLKDIDPISRTDLKEGDLVFFKVKSQMVNHVGLYLKDDYFAHASTSLGVSVGNLNDKYWDTYYYAAGRHKAVKTLY